LFGVRRMPTVERRTEPLNQRLRIHLAAARLA
jgi:hypothetical protein